MFPSRRQFIQTSGAALLPMHAAFAQTAYEVTPWAGPLSSFSLSDTTGKTWQLADLKGRAVLLNFWASWCEPCRAEMPTLQQVADLYGPDKLLVLAVNFKEPAQRALQFAKTTGVTLPVLLDVAGKTAAQWGVKVFPTTLTINPKGQPQQRVKGEVDWTSAPSSRLIESLLR
jgi:thiol-disulfide isomerase/thioredoxin